VNAGKKTFFDDGDGLVGTVHEAGAAAGTNFGIDSGFNRFLLFPLFGRTVTLRIDDGSAGAGIKTCAAFQTQVGVDVEAFFYFAVNGIFRALFGAGAAPGAVVAYFVGHMRFEWLVKNQKSDIFTRVFGI